MDAREWKEFYAREREALGEQGLRDLVERAPSVEARRGGALIFPHTRLRESGLMVAAVARAVVQSGATEVLALGVLHQGRREDATLIARARAGDAGATATMRRVHGAGVQGDERRWTDEYSLDNFCALVHAAASAAAVAPPTIVARFPFLVGSAPHSLTGIDELHALVARGTLVVATTDPVHHGVGYGTPDDELRAISEPSTIAYARECAAKGFELLAERRYDEFARHAAACRSDFRDNGPVLRAVLSSDLAPEIHGVTLVDYAATLRAPPPTWVAATLSEFAAS
jgi:hypothetical protein